MAGQIQFTRNYATFGNQLRPFERDDEVGYVVTELLFEQGYPFYPIGSIVDSKISTVWLGEGEPQAGDETNLDIIFKMREIFDIQFFEIVLRSEAGVSWGGSIYGQSLDVVDEIVAGHRVIIATADGAKDRYEYDPQIGKYLYVGTTGGAKRTARSIRKMAKIRRH